MGLTVGVVGLGYWGPNLVRNFHELEDVEVTHACDLDPRRLAPIHKRYPAVRLTSSYGDLLADSGLDAVAISTPLESHYRMALAALEAGKHVLVEKPLAATAAEADELVALAGRRGLTLMADHTFVYTGAVRKMKEIIDLGELGRIWYVDSVRINLGQFQTGNSVLWDLGPHDLAIVDYLLGTWPAEVSACGRHHKPSYPQSLTYLTLRFDDGLLAHFHLNWLAPVKVRTMLIGGSKKMIVYDDMEPTEKVRVYDRGVDFEPSRDEIHRLLVSHRMGDVWAPKLDTTEALHYVCKDFAAAIREGRAVVSNGSAGARVVKILEAADRSLNWGGAWIRVQPEAAVAAGAAAPGAGRL